MKDEPADLSPDQKREWRRERREARQAELTASREAKHRDWLLGEHDPLQNTPEQDAWDKHKADQRAERKEPRGIAVVLPDLGLGHGHRRHACKHRTKHHKASGRCRRGCNCDYAARRADAKAKATHAR